MSCFIFLFLYLLGLEFIAKAMTVSNVRFHVLYIFSLFNLSQFISFTSLHMYAFLQLKSGVAGAVAVTGACRWCLSLSLLLFKANLPTHIWVSLLHLNLPYKKLQKSGDKYIASCFYVM